VPFGPDERQLRLEDVGVGAVVAHFARADPLRNRQPSTRFVRVGEAVPELRETADAAIAASES